jgi:peptidoglycan/LPS O-acetylase OafA/YrhL
MSICGLAANALEKSMTTSSVLQPQQSPQLQGNKIEELESIRGVAALMVAIYHIPAWNTALYDVPFLRNGYLMVPLFFVLSGFVIYMTYSERITTAVEFARFQFLRFGRLYPIHLTMLLLFLGLESAKFAASHFLGIQSPNSTPFVENSWLAFVQQLLLIHAIGPTGHAETFNGPAWSISVEFYTYMIFALTLLLAKRFHLVLMATMMLLALAGLFYPAAGAYVAMLQCVLGFFLGCLTAFALKRLPRLLPGWLALGSLVLVVTYLQIKPYGSYDLLINVLSALLILCIAGSADGVAKKILRAPALKWLGTISYSLYMTHTLVIWVFIQVHRVLLKRPEISVHGKSVPQLDFMEAAVSYILVLACVLLASWLAYRFIEAPFRTKSRKSALFTA